MWTSVLQVQGESLLSSVLQVQGESSSVSQIQEESSSIQQQVQRESSSVSGCEEFGCFPLDGQMEVWWCQQPVGYLHSPECPAYRLNPFQVRTDPQTLWDVYRDVVCGDICLHVQIKPAVCVTADVSSSSEP